MGFNHGITQRLTTTAGRPRPAPALHATTQAALDAGILYKGIVFMADGVADIVDAQGNKETITAVRCRLSGAKLRRRDWGGTTNPHRQPIRLFV